MLLRGLRSPGRSRIYTAGLGAPTNRGAARSLAGPPEPADPRKGCGTTSAVPVTGTPAGRLWSAHGLPNLLSPYPVSIVRPQAKFPTDGST
jgi:hypothetical protein